MGKEKKIDCFSVPPEIIFDILKQLPVKSLLKLRCVSKLWCSIIDDIVFVNWHHTSSGTTILLVGKRYGNGCRLESTEPEGDLVHHILNLPASALKSATKYQCVNSLIYMDGCVWNLRTRERIAIPDFPPMTLFFRVSQHLQLKIYLELFLGFDPSTMEYKVLGRCSTTTTHNRIMEKTVIEYKVLTLGTNSWRDIDDSVSHQFDELMPNTDRYCCVAGVIYFIPTLDTISNENVLVAFEVGHEKFRVIRLPQGTNYDSYLIPLRERLAVIDYGLKAIWTLEDYSKQLWNKQSLMDEGELLINHNGVKLIPFGTVHTDEILVQLFYQRGQSKLIYGGMPTVGN